MTTLMKKGLALLLAAGLLFSSGLGVHAQQPAPAAGLYAQATVQQPDSSLPEEAPSSTNTSEASEAPPESAPDAAGSQPGTTEPESLPDSTSSDSATPGDTLPDASTPGSTPDDNSLPETGSQPTPDVPSDTAEPLPEADPGDTTAETSTPAPEDSSVAPEDSSTAPDDPTATPEESAEADPLAPLDTLLALAATNGAEAARLLNLYPDDDSYQAALQELLVLYYGAQTPSAQQPLFLAALDARATALAASFEAAAAERATDPFALGYMPGMVLVQFRTWLSEARAELAAEELDGSLEAVILDINHQLTTVVEIPLWQTVAQAVESFSADSAVVYAEPNYVLQLEEDPPVVQPEAVFTPDDPFVQAHHSAINTLAAWALLPDKGVGNEVVVAIIDTMPDYNHADLAGLFLPGHIKSFNSAGLTTTRSPEPNPPATNPDHATMVAGLITAKADNGQGVYGVAAGNATALNRTVCLMALDAQVDSTVSSMAKAIDYARTNGAQVINMSLGGVFKAPTTLTTAVNAAVNAGVVIVTSAGNYNEDDAEYAAGTYDNYYSTAPSSNNALHYASDYDNVLGVINLADTTYAVGTNARYKGTTTARTSPYSNYGWRKEISAPAVNVYSTSSQSASAPTGYRVGTGTSYAAPIVAGVAALVKYANPALTAQQVSDILCATATDLHLPGRDRETGYGCVNAEAAVRMALATLPVQDLTATGGHGSVSLSWNALPAATGYKVYAQAPGGSLTLLETLPASTTSTTHQGLTVGGSYQYQVIAQVGFTRQNVVDKTLRYTTDTADLANIQTEAVTIEGQPATASITVTVPVSGVALSTTSTTLKVGKTLTLTPTISPSNASNQAVTWRSSDPTVATVTAGGKVTALKAGTTTITVTTADGGHEAHCTIAVPVPVSGVTLDASSNTVYIGDSFQLSATVAPADAADKALTWKSSAPAIASVSATGRVTTHAVGAATITVTTADGGFEATCAVTVKPIPVTGVALDISSKTLPLGDAFQLTPTLSPANATDKNVTWDSSAPTVASVDATGLVTAHGVGTVTITVTTADGGFEASCALTVAATPATGITLDIASRTLTEGQTLLLTPTVTPPNATDKNVTWHSSDTTVATVEDGLVTTVGPGRAVITATTAGGAFSASCTLTVRAATTPVAGIQLDIDSQTLSPGQTLLLNPTVTPPDASNKNVTWHSSNDAVATVQGGMVFAHSAGVATITATTADGGHTASCAILVAAPVTAIKLPQTTLNLVDGKSQILPATAITSDGSTAVLSWASSDESVVTVTPDGKIVSIGTGTATITVTAANGETTSLTVTVVKKAKSVKSVSAKVPKSITAGTQKAITAQYAPSSATGVKVSYKSSKSSVLAVSSTGILTAKKAGKATITVKAGKASKKYTVTVKAPAATALKLSKSEASLKKGRTVKLKVTVTPSYADKTVTWKSSNKKVATVSSTGVVKGLKKGTATITVTAKKGKKKATCVVTVK